MKPTRRATPVAEYWDALTTAVADLEVTAAEEQELASRRARLGLTAEEVRGLHGRVFSAALAAALEDSIVTDEEWVRLRLLHSCLARLGWAPGL